MIPYILTSPLTWISVSIVAVCIVGLDFTIRPIVREFIDEVRFLS